jgi:hypothetical protein
VARGDATDENKAHLASSRGLDVTGGQDDVTDKSVRSRMDLETEALFGRHVTALLRKRAFNFRRDNRAWCCTTILPVLFVTIGFLAVRLASPERNLSPITLELSVFNPGISDSPINPIPVNSPSNPFVCQPGVCSYTPLVSVEETQETYTFCGSHINVGGGPGEDDISSINVCSLFDSTAILRTIDGFQGAVIVEANVESVLEVRSVDDDTGFASTAFDSSA